MINKCAGQWIENTRVKGYGISVADYVQQLVKAFQNPAPMLEDCTEQGPEPFPSDRQCGSPSVTTTPPPKFVPAHSGQLIY